MGWLLRFTCFGVAVDRTAHLDDITVNIVSIRETHSLRDALAGLPDGNCKCPHWGYVLSGSITVDYGDREETYEAGDAYYAPPGHTTAIEAGTDLVEFSPTDEYTKTMEVAAKNLAALQSA